jgi:hypothetical protein
MSTATLQELNQRYVRLTDRCRSQWTFYQFLQGLFKHLRDQACPVEIDFQALFAQLRQLGQDLANPQTALVEKLMDQLTARLDAEGRSLATVDREVPPSLLRRFFDRLRNQDEKILLAIIKFYLDTAELGEDSIDKIDILLTRIAEIPRGDRGSLVRERHEIERLVQPLLQLRQPPAIPENELNILLHALGDLRAEITACRTFSELASGGSLDRFRTLKRRLGDRLLHPRLLSATLETTVTIKNRFRDLWEDEEPQLLEDTNRVMELRRQLAQHPELVSPELREAMDVFLNARRRFDQNRQEENLRRENVVELRRTLDRVLEQFDSSVNVPATAGEPIETVTSVNAAAAEGVAAPASPASGGGTSDVAGFFPPDPLLHEYLSKIMFVLELVGRERPADEIVHAKELVTLRLEPWEVEAGHRIMDGSSAVGTLAGERDRLFVNGAALRTRMDEEAREIDRLQKRGSERLPEVLERGSQSLQRAAEIERRFQWFIDDALYRGDTEFLLHLYRSRFRLLRAYSGLWLIHNERGGISPF